MENKKKTKIGKNEAKGLSLIDKSKNCPAGAHWVKTHTLTVPPSKKNPSGKTIRRSHCARNPAGSEKINLTSKEIEKITKDSSFSLAKKPCSLDLGYGNSGKKYDDLIGGWVNYWNNIFESKEPLDPNLVKALISTESSFDPNILADEDNPDSGRGLMQVLNDSREILANEKGEVKEHLISVSREDLNDPSTNICVGVRWLLHKRKLLSKKLKQEATWREVIHAYKGASKVKSARAKKLLKKVFDRLAVLTQCGKK